MEKLQRLETVPSYAEAVGSTTDGDPVPAAVAAATVKLVPLFWRKLKIQRRGNFWAFCERLTGPPNLLVASWRVPVRSLACSSMSLARDSARLMSVLAICWGKLVVCERLGRNWRLGTYIDNILDLAEESGDGLADQWDSGDDARLADQEVEKVLVDFDELKGTA